jgi:hypothetical protein
VKSNQLSPLLLKMLLVFAAALAPYESARAQEDPWTFKEWAAWVGGELGNMRCEQFAFNTLIVRRGPAYNKQNYRGRHQENVAYSKDNYRVRHKEQGDQLLSIDVVDANSGKLLENVSFNLEDPLTEKFSVIETRANGVYFVWAYIPEYQSLQVEIPRDDGTIDILPAVQELKKFLKLSYMGESRWKIHLFRRGDATEKDFKVECELLRR